MATYSKKPDPRRPRVPLTALQLGQYDWLYYRQNLNPFDTSDPDYGDYNAGYKLAKDANPTLPWPPWELPKSRKRTHTRKGPHTWPRKTNPQSNNT